MTVTERGERERGELSLFRCLQIKIGAEILLLVYLPLEIFFNLIQTLMLLFSVFI